MESISRKVMSGLMALIIGSAFLPLLEYYPTISDSTINSLFALIPIMAILGFGINLWMKKRNT